MTEVRTEAGLSSFSVYHGHLHFLPKESSAASVAAYLGFAFDSHPCIYSRVPYLSLVPFAYHVFCSLFWDCNFRHLDVSYMQLHVFLFGPLLLILFTHLNKMLIYCL